MNYIQAKNILDNKHGDKSYKRLANNTYLRDRGTHIAVQLHATDIIKFYPDHFELYTGGWHTRTTKERINTYAPIRIYQEKSIWYFNDYIFVEGIKIDYTGKIIGQARKKDVIEKRFKKMKAQIKAYAEGFMQEDLKTMQPSVGDCWFCLMKPVGNMTTNQVDMNTTHLLDHMDEKYYVPSLLGNAMLDGGYGMDQVGLFIHMDLKDRMKHAIIKYMQKRLLPYE